MSIHNTDMTVTTDACLKVAMRAIDRNTLGTVFVVNDDGHLAGIATDGDIRRGILSGIGVEEPVKRVMNDDPLYVYESWPDERIEEWLSEPTVQEAAPKHRVFVIPVLDEDEAVVDFIYITKDNKILSEPATAETSVERVLVIGGAGYIGSVLSRMLLDRGYEVTVLDNLLYGRHGIEKFLDEESFTLIEGDMRSIETVMEAIQGVDAVVHLGGLVGDPASSIDPQKTLELNYHSTKMIAEICKYHQINRFVFASTCSVYGRSESSSDLLTEQSPLNPVSLYAKSKIKSERALLDIRDGNFSPTIFRKATVYGLSPRMRFDLVVNILSAKAHDEGTIPIFGGEQYRPNVHVADVAQAYIDCLESPIEDVDGEVFNVGSEEQNYQIEEIGEIVSKCFPEAEIDVQRGKEDERSYRVDFKKIEDILGYEAERTVQDGCLEIKKALESDQFENYSSEEYSNYKTLENSVEIFESSD
jgi:nucleoside-diphosphate-sugar epimerase